MSTLRFAAKAKTIVTSPTANYVTEGYEEDLKEQVSFLLQKVDKLKKEKVNAPCKCHAISPEEIKTVLRGLPSISTETAENICKLLSGLKISAPSRSPLPNQRLKEVGLTKNEQQELYLNRINTLQRQIEGDQEVLQAQQECIKQLRIQLSQLQDANTKVSTDRSINPRFPSPRLDFASEAIADKMQLINEYLESTAPKSLVPLTLQSAQTSGSKTDSKSGMTTREILKQKLKNRKESTASSKPSNTNRSVNLSTPKTNTLHYMTPKTIGSISTQWLKSDFMCKADITPGLRKASQANDSNRAYLPQSSGLSSKSINAPRKEIRKATVSEKDQTLPLLRLIEKLQKENEELRSKVPEGGQFEIFKLRAENLKMKEVLSTLAGHDVTSVLFRGRQRSVHGESGLLSSRRSADKLS